MAEVILYAGNLFRNPHIPLFISMLCQGPNIHSSIRDRRFHVFLWEKRAHHLTAPCRPRRLLTKQKELFILIPTRLIMFMVIIVCNRWEFTICKAYQQADRVAHWRPSGERRSLGPGSLLRSTFGAATLHFQVIVVLARRTSIFRRPFLERSAESAVDCTRRVNRYRENALRTTSGKASRWVS
jgi:hypothetical protein